MRTGFLFGLLLTLPASLWAENTPRLSEKALSLVRDLRATKMGIDQDDNLWTWRSPPGRIDLYTPGGEVIATTNLQNVLALDVDRRWGIAAILGPGRELLLVPWGAGTPTSIPLLAEVHGVAWIDAETVAVAPSLADHRAQIWNVREKTLVRKLGAEEVIEPKIGATVLRTVQLEYHPGRKLLYTLDSFRGDLQVFALDGRRVRHEIFPKAERELEDHLVQTDREMRERREVFTPAFWWFRLAVDVSGTAWSVHACDRSRTRATLLQIPLLGERSSKTFEASCCTLPFVIWRGWLITYSDPAAPREICNLVRRIP